MTEENLTRIEQVAEKYNLPLEAVVRLYDSFEYENDWRTLNALSERSRIPEKIVGNILKREEFSKSHWTIFTIRLYHLNDRDKFQKEIRSLEEKLKK